MQTLHTTDQARRSSGSAGRSIAFALTAALLLATACDDARDPASPAVDMTPSLGKNGNGGGGGGGGGSTSAQKIVFTNGTTMNSRIMTVNPDGSALTAVTAANEFYTPVWSPDYKKIAYVNGDGGFPPIYTMSANGSRIVKIGNGRAPRWSPDGSKIAYYRYANIGGDTQADVYVMNSDGSNIIRLTVDAAFDGHPSWSPDGTRIVFMSRRTGSDELFIMNADGTGQARLTYCASLAAECRFPRWSPAPGDQRILYTYFGATPSLRLINANGGGGATVLPGMAVYDASWSPDATKLAIAYVAPGLVTRNIYTVKLDGTQLTRLTFDTQNSESDPVWTR